jgi:hypothetical protein
MQHSPAQDVIRFMAWVRFYRSRAAVGLENPHRMAGFPE